MPHALRPAAAAAALAGLCLAAPAAAITLYDPGLATLPAAQGWTTLATGSGATQALVGGLLRSDTLSAPTALVQVIARSTPITMDPLAGFTLDFQLQLIAEAHQSANRAGYSVLVQTDDPAQGIELSFWADRVWALAYTPGGDDSGYVQGAEALLDTTAALRGYRLSVAAGAWQLSADGSALLSGSLVDYPVLGLSTAIYDSRNTLAFGDNSSRGQSVADLGLVSVSPVPEPASWAMWALAGGLGLIRWSRR